MNNIHKSFKQQIIEAQQLKEEPTQKEKLIARNTKITLYMMLFMALLGAALDQIV